MPSVKAKLPIVQPARINPNWYRLVSVSTPALLDSSSRKDASVSPVLKTANIAPTPPPVSNARLDSSSIMELVLLVVQWVPSLINKMQSAKVCLSLTQTAPLSAILVILTSLV